jgi:hypothetical protein
MLALNGSFNVPTVESADLKAHGIVPRFADLSALRVPDFLKTSQIQKPSLLEVSQTGVPNTGAAVGFISRSINASWDLFRKGLDNALSSIASDPKTVASVASGLAAFGFDLLPFMGPIKKFADGRALFLQNNLDLKNEGRTLCLISLLELGLDAVTAGGSALIPDEILTYPRMLRDYQRRMQQQTSPAKMFPDPVSLVVRGLLKIPGVSSILDRAISATIAKD